MFDNLEETRYPFNNFLEFIGGGYWQQTGAIHLFLGWVFIIALTISFLRTRKYPLHFRTATLYFALTIFTNPAYDFAGLKINEIFGIFSIAVSTITRNRQSPLFSPKSPIVLGLLAVFLVGALHNLLVAFIYPELNPDAKVVITRTAVNLKILTLAVNLLIVSHTLKQRTGIGFLLKTLVISGTFGLAMYLLQGVVLLFTGIFPYGTFLDAGFIGIPTFGSVSIERGHFGKFMAPLFPFFLYCQMIYRWRLPFYLLIFVACINFSSSSQTFFLAFGLLAIWLFRSKFTHGYASIGIVLLAVAISTFVIIYWKAFFAVGVKIWELAFVGDESTGGGRSIGTFSQYIEKYPFGIGYSGSTLRTAPGLPEINAAHFAFFAQYSLLAIPIIFSFLWLVLRTIRIAKAQRTNVALTRNMIIAVLGSCLIFAADILWFIPTIWLAYEIIWTMKPHFRSSTSYATPISSLNARPINNTHTA
ncbi:MAG: hypothetical protein AB7T07_05255 [Steroidobacteraceae bacterium]